MTLNGIELSWNDYLHTVTASCIDPHRSVSYLNGYSYVTHKEIWARATKAAARKATADGVNHICIDETGGKFYIFQISGYTPDRGMFCDLLDEQGKVTPQKNDRKSIVMSATRQAADNEYLEYCEGLCLGDTVD